MLNNPGLRILFEDTHLVVVSKPAGLLSQGEETGAPNLVDELRAHFGRNYVGLVHRLDRNTSGLIVVAKRSKAALRLTEALQLGELRRAYLAVVQGHLAGRATWEHRLLKDEKTNVVRVVASGGKEARLSVEGVWLGEFLDEPLSLVRLELDTGRSHQIRVQAAAEGHPLVGDLKYGAKTLAEPFKNFARPALHSAFLDFAHPMSQEKLHFEDPLPADMQALVKK